MTCGSQRSFRGRYQFRSPSSVIGGQEHAADDRRVDQDGGREADAHLLHLQLDDMANIENTATMTIAALVTTPAVLLIP